MRLLRICALPVIVASATLATPVMAADLIISEPAPVFAPATYDWTGFYAGIHGGYAFGETDMPWGAVGGPHPNDDGPVDLNSFYGGAHLGYLQQSGSFVYGIEGAIDYLPVSGNDGGAGGDINDFEGQFMASLVGRLGVAQDNVLFYLTGGGAYLRGTGTDQDFAVTVDYDLLGWTAGAGIEMGITETVTARLDYRYAGFSTQYKDYSLGYELGVNPGIHLISAGVSMRF